MQLSMSKLAPATQAFITMNKPSYRATKPYRLALDLGQSSIGWAVYLLDKNLKVSSLIDLGTAIHPHGLNSKMSASKGAERRKSRLARRTNAHKRQRMNALLKALTNHKLFPACQSQQNALKQLHPYALRAKGVTERLEPFEFGRALLHLAKFRGPKFNRLSDDKKETGILKEGASKLEGALAERGYKTIAQLQHEHHLGNQDSTCAPQQVKMKKRRIPVSSKDAFAFYSSRTAVLSEFDILWERQKQEHPCLLTDDARDAVFHAIFDQRPVLMPEPGRCPYHPEGPRISKAHPLFQEYRLRQTISDIRLTDSMLRKRALTDTEYEKLYEALSTRKEMKFPAIRTLLKLDDCIRISHEYEGAKALKGNETAALLGHKDRFGPTWAKLPLHDQTAVVVWLLTQDDEDALIAWLQDSFALTEDRARNIANTSLPIGQGGVGVTATMHLLQFMRLHHSAHEAGLLSGYNDARLMTGEIYDELPYYGEALPHRVGFGDGVSEALDRKFGRIANPSVHIGLNQLRKLVNALIAKHGQPTQVIIEVADEIKLSAKALEARKKANADNRFRKERHHKELDKLGIPEGGRRDALLKMALWEELGPGPEARFDVYSGERITLKSLFNGDFEVEHILPMTRSEDNSPANKTLCSTHLNRLKGNRTPWEAFSRDRMVSEDEWHKMLERARAALPRKKADRFTEAASEKLIDPEGFLDRHLHDTRYLCQVAKEYLSLVCDPLQVWVTSGRFTAALRTHLQLNTLLNKEANVKNRDDHRHHALDAAVIGLMDRVYVTEFRRFEAALVEHRAKPLEFRVPYARFRDELECKLEYMTVFHRPNNGFQPGKTDMSLCSPGEILVDTIYRLEGDKPAGNELTRVSQRVEVLKYFDSMKKLLEADMAEQTRASMLSVIEPELAANPPKDDKQKSSRDFAFKSALLKWADKTGTNRVRIYTNKRVVMVHGKHARKCDNNSFVDVFQQPDGQWMFDVVSAYDAITMGTEPRWKKTYPAARKVMRLYKNDMVCITEERRAYIYRVVSFTPGRLRLQPHNMAKGQEVSSAASTWQKMSLKKINVDILGHVKGLPYFDR
ncbi:type II CRISPR RNA-guided endonuclease Cas9 [Thalassospira xiamenensis]|uniref:CRISPR-associated endonuclease Cas9 n=1 Tax=Thalassospira xiamenensis TaxID=220697 RepID=A0A285TUA9_9PROT|nr:type II CRISPR RNA-guided endonuclease Cas9 [Thalassospira xiamenensis]SOC26997.1 CRISPR-associated endonuclease, Csn1 family [Thalassospira xiamenensis]